MLKKLGFLAVFLSLFLLPISLLAIETHSGDVVFLATDQTINHNYYGAGQNVEIYGTVNGDLFIAGNNIIIDSENINGDIFAAGSNLTIKGNINGSVRFAGEQFNLDGQVRDNVLFLGQSITISSESVIGGHLTAWGQQVSLRGQVAGDLEGGLETLNVSGQVGQDVDVYVSKDKQALQFMDGAVIGGSVKYHAWQEVEISDQVQIGGAVTFEQLVRKAKPIFAMAVLWQLILKFFGMLVLGMLLIYLWPRFFPHTASRIRKHPWKTLFIGLAILVLTPIISLILMITIIGLPVAFIILASWVALLYIAKIMAAWIIGDWLKKKLFAKYKWSSISVLALGIFIYLIISKIPVVGWIIILILFLWSWGVIANILHKKGIK